jgi:hypothetical protein
MTIGIPSVVVALLDLSTSPTMTAFPGIANAFVGVSLGLSRLAVDVFYRAPIPPAHIERIIHPGDGDYPPTSRSSSGVETHPLRPHVVRRLRPRGAGHDVAMISSSSQPAPATRAGQQGVAAIEVLFTPRSTSRCSPVVFVYARSVIVICSPNAVPLRVHPDHQCEL